MKSSILWKLLGINIAVLATAMLIIWVMIDVLAEAYFMELMTRFNIDPADSHNMFVDTVHRYLIQASAVAILASVALSFLWTRRILKPLSQMTAITRQVAAGDFKARVGPRGDDEVGELALAFDRMADSLERMERLRKTMVSDISHELRTPMTNIRGYLEGLADGVIEPSKETYEILQREIMRLVRLVDDLGDLAKAESGALTLTLGSVDLNALFDEIRVLESPQMDRRDLRLERAIAPEAARVRADSDKLLQILCNILQNAWRYAMPGSAVRVETRRHTASDGRLVEIVVINRGAEIETTDLPLIFERFYRADKSRSRDSGGGGVGLAIVKELVEAHGGAVGAESDDGETRVWVRLPAA